MAHNTNLTDDEAAKRWCPFVRLGVYAGSGAVAVNRHPEPLIEADMMCRGSRCMAWRENGMVDPATRQGRGRCGLVPS